MTRIFYIIITTFLLLSCGQKKSKEDNETSKAGNISTTISSDTSKLSKLINIDAFRPTQVKFKYIFIDNSGQNERLSVPGPSDNYLEAVLYFDTTTFKALRTKYFDADYLSSNFDKLSFNFEWLDNDIKKELMKSDTNYHGHPDFFLGLGHSGKLWFLDNKLLLIKPAD
jgi:hypothetical protein